MYNIYIILLLFIFVHTTWANGVFHESMDITILEDHHVLVSATFTTTVTHTSTIDTHTWFPKNIDQIMDRYNVDEFSLSLTKGRQKHFLYYMQDNLTTGPQGAELYAYIDSANNHTTYDMVRFHGLKHALSGLFCTSISHIKDERITNSYNPSKMNDISNIKKLPLYTSMPGETVCTENLTPWLKLLPCGRNIGISKYLDSYIIFDSSYHSLNVKAWKNESMSYVQESIVYVVDIGKSSFELNELIKIHNNDQNNYCPLASSSTLKIIIPDWMSYTYTNTFNELLKWDTNDMIFDNNDIYIQLYGSVSKKNNNNNNDIQFIYNLYDNNNNHINMYYKRKDRYSRRSPHYSMPKVTVEKYITGYGQLYGDMTIRIANSDHNNSYLTNYYDIYPNFIQIYVHSIVLYVKSAENNEKLSLNDVNDSIIKFIPSINNHPSQLLFQYDVQPNTVLEIHFQFKKQFLSITEFPPDVSRGFDLPQGILTVHQTNKHQNQNYRTFSNAVVVLLPFPDQSMPFNVIAFVSTVLAMLYGTMFHALYSTKTQLIRKRTAENGFSKLIKKLKRN